MCSLCGEEYDTSLHLLGRCTALVEKRRKQFGKSNWQVTSFMAGPRKVTFYIWRFVGMLIM